MFRLINYICVLLLALCGGSSTVYAAESTLLVDSTCTITILNRSVQARDNGSFELTNIPSFMGRVRAQATCIRDGKTLVGQSDYFEVQTGQQTEVGQFYLSEAAEVPQSLKILNSQPVIFDTTAQRRRLKVLAQFASGTSRDASDAVDGTNFISSNPAIVTVDANGWMQSVSSGTAMVTVRKDGVVAIIRVEVAGGGDSDGDGIPDDVEITLGLNPNDPVDAREDQDGDGLSSLDEYELGTDPNNPDSDGDGIQDGEEMIPGGDGFVTNPLLADSDGDGINDGLEVSLETSPINASDVNYTRALVALSVFPDSVSLNLGNLSTESNLQIQVTALLSDGSRLDVTPSRFGTLYESSAATIANADSEGLVSAVSSGETSIQVTLGDEFVDVPVTVEQFTPVGVATLALPGFANAIDVQGNIAAVAAGDSGLVLVDISNKEEPIILANYQTYGTAISVKISGDRIYLSDTQNGLSILDISNPNTPELYGEYNPGDIVRDIEVNDEFVFLACQDAGLRILDVVKPDKPTEFSTLEGLGQVGSISVSDDLAVVATDNAARIIDVSSLRSPVWVTSIASNNIRDVLLDGTRLFISRSSSGYLLYDLENPVSPQVLNSSVDYFPNQAINSQSPYYFSSDQRFQNSILMLSKENVDSTTLIDISDVDSSGRTSRAVSVDSHYIYQIRDASISARYGKSGNALLVIAQFQQNTDGNQIQPTIELTKPTNFDVFVMDVPKLVAVSASDDLTVASVEFWLDGVQKVVDTVSPYQAFLTSNSSEATSILKVIANDAGGNSSEVEVELAVEQDTDGDGLGNEEEITRYTTNPENYDTDKDGIPDGLEVRLGISPLQDDSDGDGIDDLTELNNDTDPNNPDITAPEVFLNWPEDTATDIPENSQLTIEFTEPLRRSSISSSNIILYEGDASNGQQRDVSVSLSSDRTSVTVSPVDLMTDTSLHTVIVRGLKDDAGNEIDEVIFSFTTGDSLDTELPSVVTYSPGNNSDLVPINSQITIEFSEPMYAESINESNIQVQDTVTGDTISVFVVLDDNKTIVSLIPAQPLKLGRRHKISISGSVKDSFRNKMGSSFYSYFTTSFDADGTAPNILGVSFLNDQEEIPLNAKLSIRFDEAINVLGLDQFVLLDEAGNNIDSYKSIDNKRSAVSISPVDGYQADKSYTLNIGNIEDLSGNKIEETSTINFKIGRTNDLVRGKIRSWSIDSGAENVPLNTRLSLTVSERLDPVSVRAGAMQLYDDTLNRYLDGTPVLSEDGLSVTFELAEPLQAGHVYRLGAGNSSYSSAYLWDLAGNNFYGGYTSFTTGNSQDEAAPQLIFSSVSPGASDVPVNAQWVVTLNEPIGGDCFGSASLVSENDTIPLTLDELSNDRQTLTLTAESDLAVSTEYQLQLDVCDYAGNALVIDSDNVVQFTTSNSSVFDTTAPSLISMTPEHYQEDVSVAASEIVLTFNEPVDLSTLPIPSAYTNSTSLPLSGEWHLEGNVATFTLTEPMLGGLFYYGSEYVEDLAGNRRYVDVRFTTETVEDTEAPTLLAMSPAAGSVNIDPGTEVHLSFSEPMSSTYLTNQYLMFYSNGEIISPSVSRSTDGREVVLDANLPAHSIVSVVLRKGLRDLSGNLLEETFHSFITGEASSVDRSGPSVSVQIPSRSSREADVDSILLVMEFDQTPERHR